MGLGPWCWQGNGDHFTRSRGYTGGLGWGDQDRWLLLLRGLSNSLHFYGILTLGKRFQICLFPSHG